MPDTASETAPETATPETAPPPEEARNVLIVGAGPAGLLTAIFLLRRNLNRPRPKYRVTVVDPGVDYGPLSSEELKRYRSWMIGLSCHGLSAIRKVPGLYEDYVRGVGVVTKYGVTGLGKFLMPRVSLEDLGMAEMAFTVDRNYIVAALSRYLADNFGGSEQYAPMFNTRAIFVDGENRRVLVRPRPKPGGNTKVAGDRDGDGDRDRDRYLDYDLLIGCDGIRSVVRNAFMTRHREFEFDLRGTFGLGKSIHLPLPDEVEEGTFMLLFNCMPKIMAVVLPETGRKVNFACGFKDADPCDPDLLSKDVATVSKYLRAHFTAFPVDFDSMAREWVAQDFFSTQQVHCNFYHSLPLRALLMGDAAHATSPQIGQGMNTALADAWALNELLDGHGDGDGDLDAVLAGFSEERVKEGNALTDLSFHTFSLSATQQLWLLVQAQVRDWLHRRCPALFEEYPMTSIPARGMQMSEAYDRMTRLGIIPRVRRTNDEIMRRHFERTVGMVKEGGGGVSAWTLFLAVFWVALIVALVQFSLLEGHGWKVLA